ncbi:MAG: OmpH family outer membrane protein [Myxococcota bacterium]
MTINRRASLFCVVVVLSMCMPSFAKTSLQEQLQALQQRLQLQGKEIERLQQQLQQPQVAYVSGKLLEQTLEGKFRMEELKEKRGQLEKQLRNRDESLKKKEQDLLKKRTDLQQQAGMMTPQALQQQQVEFQKEATAFQQEAIAAQKMKHEYQEQIAKMQEKFSMILKAKMEPVKQTLEKSLGLPILYEEVLFSAGPALNVTKQLVHAYNEKYPWPPPEAKQPTAKKGQKHKKKR